MREGTWGHFLKEAAPDRCDHIKREAEKDQGATGVSGQVGDRSVPGL